MISKEKFKVLLKEDKQNVLSLLSDQLMTNIKWCIKHSNGHPRQQTRKRPSRDNDYFINNFINIRRFEVLKLCNSNQSLIACIQTL